MKQLIASVTQRGQVTIPAEVRRIIGAKPRGKIVFQVDGKEVRLAAAPMTLAESFGSVQPPIPPASLAEIERAAKDEHVDRFVQKLRNP